MVVLGTIALLTPGLVAGLLQSLLVLVLWPVMLLLAYVAWVPFHQRSIARNWTVPAFLAAGTCASCRLPLKGLNPAPDGCTVCPECRAAWRLQGEGTKGQSDEGTEGGAA